MRDDEREIWAALELPEPMLAPPGFAGRVLSRARAERVAAERPLFGSAGVRLAAAVAVAAGIAGGMVLASWSESSTVADSPFAWSDTTLAELYVTGAGGGEATP